MLFMKNGKWLTIKTSNHYSGTKPNIVADDQIDLIVSWVEEDCTITLQQLKEKIVSNFNKMVSVSTVENYYEGRLYSIKGVRH